MCDSTGIGVTQDAVSRFPLDLLGCAVLTVRLALLGPITACKTLTHHFLPHDKVVVVFLGCSQIKNFGTLSFLIVL